MKNRRLLGITVALLLGAICFWFLSQRRLESTATERASAPTATTKSTTPTPSRDRGSQPIRLTPAIAVEQAEGSLGAFSGHVVSSLNGEGVANAELTFELAGGAHSARTGPRGEFHFKPPFPATYQLGAIRAPGFLPFAPAWGESPVSLTAVKGSHIEGLKFVLTPAREYVGRVVDPSGKPVAQAQIRLFTPSSAGVHEAALSLPDRFRSDPQGEFRFAAPEDSVLEAQHPAWGEGRAHVDAHVSAQGKLTLKLTPKSSNPEPAAHAVISGKVVDSAGTGLDGAWVTAQRQGSASSPTPYPEHQARTGDDGSFQLPELKTGAYDLSIRHEGFAPQHQERIAAGTRDVLVTLKSGRRLVGRVLDDQSGNPIPSFSITLLDSKEPLARRVVKVSSVVNVGGFFQLEGLPEGDHAIIAIAHDYAPSTEVKVAAADGQPNQVEIRLSKGSTLTGMVRARDTKKPLAGAQVTLESLLLDLGSRIPTSLSVTTNEAGRFEMSGMAEGTRSLMVMASGYHGRIMSGLQVSKSGPQALLDIDLSPLKEGEDPSMELVGIGAVLSAQENALLIVQVLPDGGGAEVGLGSGDTVLEVDGRKIAELGFVDAVERIRGPENSWVTLSVRKKDGDTQVLRVPRRRISS